MLILPAIFLLNCLKQKLKREHLLKSTLRKQSNNHQNSHTTSLKADKKKLPVATGSFFVRFLLMFGRLLP